MGIQTKISLSTLWRCGFTLRVFIFCFRSALSFATFYFHAINFRLQYGWKDHYQYRKWNETTTTYDNNPRSFDSRTKQAHLKQDKTKLKQTSIHTIWHNNGIPYTLWDIETSLSFEIVGWKTTTAGYFPNIIMHKQKNENKN